MLLFAFLIMLTALVTAVMHPGAIPHVPPHAAASATGSRFPCTARSSPTRRHASSIGTRQSIYQLLRDVASKGVAVVVASTDTDELVRLVDSGKAKAAFSMYPTSLEQLMAISDANEIMPPKSTWFEPKLADGLVSHMLD